MGKGGAENPDDCLICLEILHVESTSIKKHEMETLENLEHGVNVFENRKWKFGIEYGISIYEQNMKWNVVNMVSISSKKHYMNSNI